jgi:hypothetical protein
MEHPVTALYDANILYPAPIRDLFIRLAHAGLVRARWTDAIHDEWVRNLLADNPSLSPGRLARTRSLMNEAVRDSLVAGYQDLIESVSLPDPDDRHVLAAAIRADAEVIVTFNLKDFLPIYWPTTRLRQCTPMTSCWHCLTRLLGLSVPQSSGSGRGCATRQKRPKSYSPRSKVRDCLRQLLGFGSS